MRGERRWLRRPGRSRRPQRPSWSREIGDVYEVLAALMAAFGVSLGDMRAAQERRRSERGGFPKRLKLVSVDERR